jgi:RND superfamily putative drug exporter
MSAAEIDAVTVPPAPAERGPIPPNANAADPATNASLAFASGISSPPTPDNSPDGEHAAVMAEEAAARAPDTAAADEAKRKIYAEYAARGSVGANATGTGTNNSMNGSSANGAANNGATTHGATTNAPSVSSSGTEPIGAQSNDSSGSEPMATEDAPRPATVDKS